ncbi:hypothetical protein Tco_1403749 [Tanacetum coccineum]
MENVDLTVMKNMDAYRDKDMGDVIFRKPFCRDAGVEARRFDRFITIHNDNDSVTYQMARSHLRFKHLSNKQCNKIRPLLKRNNTLLKDYNSIGKSSVLVDKRIEEHNEELGEFDKNILSSQ